MSDQINKPKGTFSKLMSTSPIQQDQGIVSGKPENLKSWKPAIMETRKPENLKPRYQEFGETRKPENLKSGNRDYLKAIKYSTQLHPDLIKRLKQYALAHDVKDYEVLQKALTEYLNKSQS
jgi:hypothetical protein